MNKILWNDCRKALPIFVEGIAQCCVTSPPYWELRDYKIDGQIGHKQTPEEYVTSLVEVFSEVRRVLRKDGTLWLNISDSYNSGASGGLNGSTLSGSLEGQSQSNRAGRKQANGLKPKDMVGIPWRVAFALQADGWYLRSAIIWAKPNGMPGSQQDRPTSSYEFVFLLSKSAHYYSDFDAIKTTPRESSMIRTAQNVQAQAGSHRANGGAKTNGPMRAIGGPKTDKQRGHSRLHAGFNARWDSMSKEEQTSQPAMIRDVWFVSPGGYKGAHYAVMPEEIARRCILAGSKPGGIVLDPFMGSGTTAATAIRHGREYIGCEMNRSDNEVLQQERIAAAYKSLKTA